MDFGFFTDVNERLRDEMAENGEDRTYSRKKWYGWSGVAVLLIGVMLFLYYVYPTQDIGPQQPIFFSHRVHAGVKEINCRFCHPYVDRGRHAGLPTMEKCFFCHKYIITEHPQLVKEKQHLESKSPVPWVRIYYTPDFVKFKHQPHIVWGKIDCTVCHGPVSTMDRLRPIDFQMKFCIGCHKKMNAQTDCYLTCHH